MFRTGNSGKTPPKRKVIGLSVKFHIDKKSNNKEGIK